MKAQFTFFCNNITQHLISATKKPGFDMSHHTCHLIFHVTCHLIFHATCHFFYFLWWVLSRGLNKYTVLFTK